MKRSSAGFLAGLPARCPPDRREASDRWLSSRTTRISSTWRPGNCRISASLLISVAESLIFAITAGLVRREAGCRLGLACAVAAKKCQTGAAIGVPTRSQTPRPSNSSVLYGHLGTGLPIATRLAALRQGTQAAELGSRNRWRGRFAGHSKQGRGASNGEPREWVSSIESDIPAVSGTDSSGRSAIVGPLALVPLAIVVRLTLPLACYRPEQSVTSRALFDDS